MRPPFAYYGGKVGLAPRIVELLPPHRVYIEPFAGSLAVLFAKRPAMHEIVNDVDGALVTFFRVLRDQPDELERVCALTPHARAEFEAAILDAEGLTDLELARRFFVRVTQSFAKTANTTTGWSVTTARTQSIPGTIAGRISRFAALAERLRAVSIERCDAAALIERLATADTVVYCDPPYVAATRNSASKRLCGDYRHEMTDADHRTLAAVLQATPAAVVLSGYPGHLYDELFPDWHTLDVPVVAYSSSGRRKGGDDFSERAARIERLWSNRPLGHGPLFRGAA